MSGGLEGRERDAVLRMRTSVYEAGVKGVESEGVRKRGSGYIAAVGVMEQGEAEVYDRGACQAW